MKTLQAKYFPGENTPIYSMCTCICLHTLLSHGKESFVDIVNIVHIAAMEQIMLEDLVRMVCRVLFLSLQLQLIALPSCPVLNSLDTLDLTIGHTTLNISSKMDSNLQELSRVSFKRNATEGNIIGEVVPGRGDITWIIEYNYCVLHVAITQLYSTQCTGLRVLLAQVYV